MGRRKKVKYCGDCKWFYKNDKIQYCSYDKMPFWVVDDDSIITDETVCNMCACYKKKPKIKVD